MSEEHISVLLNEAIEGLAIKPDGIYADLTLGRAGHSLEILKRLTCGGKLFAFDLDEEAIAKSKEKLSAVGDNFEIIHSNFRYFAKELNKRGINHVDGVLMDLGVSSPQFDEGERGFSYRFDAPLDMRMDASCGKTARDIINTYSINELARIFREYGEDKYAYQVAKKVVEKRRESPIETTEQLVNIIKASKPNKELAKKGHPAKQIFQALRIEVNDELNNLKYALSDALDILKKDGRIAVITFHSLEDRIVKTEFAKVSKIIGDRNNDFIKPCDIKKPEFALVNNKVIVPSIEEITRNSRSKSAKLRIIKKL